jgi:hypothetical protein
METLDKDWCHYSGMPSPNAYKLSLRDCFNEDFTEWLENSNYIGDINPDAEYGVLKDILDILLREPLADYFWYGYPDHGGGLSYSLPHHDTVPGGALRVDKDKIKVFLRDIKLDNILN